LSSPSAIDELIPRVTVEEQRQEVEHAAGHQAV
jgi:hypothetical protein